MQKKELLERSIVTLILLNVEKSKEAAHLLKPEYFDNHELEKAASCIIKLYDDGKEPDLTNVVKSGFLSEIEYFSLLRTEAIQDALIRKSNLIDYVNELIRLYSESIYYKTLAISKSKLENNEINASQSFEHISDVINESLIDTETLSGIDYFSSMYEPDENFSTHNTIQSGIPFIDHCFKSMRGGRFFVIAGRTGLGKSTICIQSCVNLIQQNKKVVYISLEMSGNDLTAKALSNFYKLDAEKLITRDDKLLEKLQDAYSTNPLNLQNLLINDKVDNLDDIILAIRKSVKDLNTTVFVDHLGLIETTQEYGAKDYLQVAHITRKLHKLSRELNVPIIGVNQINREGDGKMPMLSHLAGGSRIEQDVDGVIILHQEKTEDEEGEIVKNKPQTLSVNVAKNRTGEARIFKNALKFHGAIQTFKSVF